MPIYTDTNTKRLYIEFQYKGIRYKRRLPANTSKSDAKDFEAKWKHDLFLESMGMGQTQDLLFETFLTEYFLPFAEKHYSEMAFKNVRVILKSSLKFLGGLKLRQIKTADIEEFKSFRAELKTQYGRRRKPATIHRELNIISKVFSEAVRLGYLDFNPCRRVTRPKVRNIQNKTIPLDKTEEFLENIYSAWARDVAVLILNTGLRQNDALGLKKSSADFDKRVLTLRQGKSQRTVSIPMNKTVFDLLSEKKDAPGELFFPSPKTGRQGTSIKTALIGAGRRSGLGKVGTRVLRRTFATRLAELNFNPGAVVKLLGHSDLRTAHRYERETEILREAVDALDSANPAKIPPEGDGENS